MFTSDPSRCPKDPRLFIQNLNAFSRGTPSWNSAEPLGPRDVKTDPHRDPLGPIARYFWATDVPSEELILARTRSPPVSMRVGDDADVASLKAKVAGSGPKAVRNW